LIAAGKYVWIGETSAVWGRDITAERTSPERAYGDEEEEDEEPQAGSSKGKGKKKEEKEEEKTPDSQLAAPLQVSYLVIDGSSLLHGATRTSFGWSSTRSE
jgi:hypothetical protein